MPQNTSRAALNASGQQYEAAVRLARAPSFQLSEAAGVSRSDARAALNQTRGDMTAAMNALSPAQRILKDRQMREGELHIP